MSFQLGILRKVYLLLLLSVGFEISGSHCPSEFKKTNGVCTRAYTEQQETAREAEEICEQVETSGKLVIVHNDLLAEFSDNNSSFSLTKDHVYFVGPYPPCGDLCYAIQYNNAQSTWQVVGISCDSVIYFICQTDIFYDMPPVIDSSSVQYQLSSYGIMVQWQEPSTGHFTGFQLVAEDTVGTMIKIDLDDVTTNTDLTGLCGGREYTFYLYSVNGNVFSQPISFTEYTSPTAVECVNVTHTGNHVTFSWFPVEGVVTFYEVFLLEVDKMKLKSKGVYSETMDVMYLTLSKGLINSKRHDLIIETVLVLQSEEKKSIFQLPLNPDDTLIEERFCNPPSPSSSSASALCSILLLPDEITTLGQQSSTAAQHCPSIEGYLTIPSHTSSYPSTRKRALSTSATTREDITSLKSSVSTNTKLTTSTRSTEEQTSPSERGHFMIFSTIAYETSTSTNMATEEDFAVRTTLERSKAMESSTDKISRTPTLPGKTPTTSASLQHGQSTSGIHKKTEHPTNPGELLKSTDRESTSVVTSYSPSQGTLYESTSLQLSLTGKNIPTINTENTSELRATQAQTTPTYQSIETSENFADSDPVTTLIVLSQNKTSMIPEDDNPFVNCSFSSQLNSSSENLTKAATRFIELVLSGILSSDSFTLGSNSSATEDHLDNCSLPEAIEGSLTVDVLAGYITEELLRLTSDDVTINIDDQPGVKDFKLIVNPLTLQNEERESLDVEFESGIEIGVPFSTFNQSDCCKAILLYEEDEDSWTYPVFDNYCAVNNSQQCSLVPRLFHIATISVYPPPQVDLFVEPIQLQFNRQRSVTTDPEANSDLVPTCAWLDEETSTETKLVWETENIVTYRQPNDDPSTGSDVEVIKCLSYHLTSFSVIMKPAELQLEENHYRALSIISMVGSVITIISAVITIGVFIFLGILKQQRIVHSNLISAVGISHLVFIIGIDKVQNKVFCSLVSVFLFYFLSATFCWMLMEATYLYVSVVQVFAGELKVIRYTLIGWGLPLFIVGVTVISSFQQLTSDLYCWLPVKGNKILAFIIPSVVIIVVNLILLFAVLYEINKMVKRNITDVKISRSRTTAKALLLMLPLVGTPWIFALFALNSNLVIFDYLFNIFNSFQGLWIFLLHIVGNKEVRTRLRAKVSPQSTRNDWGTQTTNSPAPSESLPMTKMSSA